MRVLDLFAFGGGKLGGGGGEVFVYWAESFFGR